MHTDDILNLIQNVAEEVVNPRFRALAAGEVTEKSPGDLVTVADHEAEVLLTRELLGAYPQAVVLGEEASAADVGLIERFQAAEHAFTVDPVDGTKNFVHGSPDHAVMVSELRKGVVVRSWIWQPQHEQAYVAELGAGAWCNGVRLRTVGPAAERRGVTSRRSWIGRRLGELPALELTWVCCGVDYPKLIQGAADYLLYATTKPWDHAPGALLLTEAGGWLGTSEGDPYRPSQDQPGVLVAAIDQPTGTQVASLLPGLV